MLSSVLALSANRKADPLIYALGPRARRVYIALRATILSGAHVPGDKLPSHLKLAVEYGVAPLTLRHVLAQLEADGLVSREHGRGTFIQACTAPGVLVVDDDRVSRMVLSRQLHLNGYQPLEAADPAAALAILQQVARIALVLTDVRMPSTADGVAFIRTVRRRWPHVPLAAVTGFAADLSNLIGTPDCPLLMLSKPVQSNQLQDLLELVHGQGQGHGMALVA
jgi:CheY-like chemotaxis protein